MIQNDGNGDQSVKVDYTLITIFLPFKRKDKVRYFGTVFAYRKVEVNVIDFTIFNRLVNNTFLFTKE